MIKTVVREHKWLPEHIQGLYLDDIDLFGLIYWYTDVVEMIKELKAKEK